ncbi:MAG: polysaccharide biosynthesis protein, partial [bacterium]
VTGAGGTIGLELCRQVLKYGPAKLVALENHATSLFYCEGELRRLARGVALSTVLGDVRDEALVERVFRLHAPQVVLHAAAHKHVHQLETNVHEGITNNVLGTWNVARAADRQGAEVFLLISTDKAVKPRSVMGATKRVAELIVRALGRAGRTRFIGVRFGNVLGSSGSVLGIFQQQIADGGPVTVTDERATRYFMTVEESVGLILQAVSMAKGGEIFVLKMGTPVRIMDMARNLILLSGLEPGKDIEIKVTGLKQGEKLDEELAEDPSEMSASGHPDITVLKPDPGDAAITPVLVAELEALSRSADPGPVVRKLQGLIPTFHPDPAHN